MNKIIAIATVAFLSLPQLSFAQVVETTCKKVDTGTPIVLIWQNSARAFHKSLKINNQDQTLSVQDFDTVSARPHFYVADYPKDGLFTYFFLNRQSPFAKTVSDPADVAFAKKQELECEDHAQGNANQESQPENW